VSGFSTAMAENFVSYNSNLKIWSGEPIEHIYNTKTGIGQLILNVLRQTPERVTQISHEKNVEVTCGEMYLRSIKMANYLKNQSYVQNDVVGIIARNSENLAPVIFASLALGMPINPLDSIMKKSDIVHVWRKIKPKIIFCDHDDVELAQSALNELKLDAKICTFLEKVGQLPYVDDILKEEFDINRFV
jgi:4-coumarate--CoA ligase